MCHLQANESAVILFTHHNNVNRRFWTGELIHTWSGLWKTFLYLVWYIGVVSPPHPPATSTTPTTVLRRLCDQHILCTEFQRFLLVLGFLSDQMKSRLHIVLTVPNTIAVKIVQVWKVEVPRSTVRLRRTMVQRLFN